MLFEKNLNSFTVNNKLPLEKFYEKINTSSNKFYCVIDKDTKLLGVISLGDIVRNGLVNNTSNKTVADIMNTKFYSLHMGVSSATLRYYLEKYRFVPIVDEFNKLKILAYGYPNKREFIIGRHYIKNQEDYMLIAEIGNNHNGSLDRAFDLIKLAKQSGANMVKFQMRDLSSLYGDTNTSQDLSTEYVVNLLKKFSLSDEDIFRCFDYCKKIGITPLCTPFDVVSVKKLEKYGMDGYKVSSADLTNDELLKALIATNKPLIISTGMSTDEDIDHAILLLESNYVNYVICHSNSTYPTPYEDINLNYIESLKAKTNSVIGYSGHERGWHIPLAAFAKGAQVIEKHFTLDKTLEGNDHKVSLLPEEFLQMSKQIKDISKSLGIGYKREISQGEMINKIALSKSLFSNKDIKKGEIIIENNIIIRSPGNGLSPKMKNALIGKISKRDIKAGDPFYEIDLKDNIKLTIEKKPKNFKWCIPVRHRDIYELFEIFNPPAIEFHLSFKDLDLNDEEILQKKLKTEVIVHAPEQFEDDFILDLFSSNTIIVDKTVKLLNQIFTKARKIADLIGYKDKPKVIVNCGGHTQNGFLSKEEIKQDINNFIKNIQYIDFNNCRFLAQTMPPYPWHFGGQSFHNQFTSAKNIKEILEKTDKGIELCLDISHSYMWCNYSKESFSNFIKKISSKVSHIHISDAIGTSEEGMQIGEGEIDFEELREAILPLKNRVTLLPEIWQGHDNFGEGFKIALERLYELGY